MFSKKGQVVTANYQEDKLIIKSEITKHIGKDVYFEVPEQCAGCLIYDNQAFVFFPEDKIISLANEVCSLPKKFFTKGKAFEFYLLNLDYNFDTVKTAVTNLYYVKDKLPGVKIKCTFRIDLHIQLLKYKKETLRSIIVRNADKIDDLDTIIQNEVSPALKRIVSEYIANELALVEHKYEEFIKPAHQDAIEKKVIVELKDTLAEYGVKPIDLTINIFTPEEGETRLTKINDLMFEKVVDDLEHSFHDERRKDLREDREFEVKLQAQTSETKSKLLCPQCNNEVEESFAFCPFCQKELK